MDTTKLNEDVGNALELIDWLHDQLDGLFIPHKNKIPCALYYISMQHSEGALILLDNKREAPAFALARPIYETFLRALWFSLKATLDEQKKAVAEDNFPILRKIVGIFNQPHEADLVKMYDDIKVMHSFTHGGTQQIFNHINSTTLESCFDASYLNTLIDVSTRLAIASSLQFTELLGAIEARNRIFERVMPIYGKPVI